MSHLLYTIYKTRFKPVSFGWNGRTSKDIKTGCHSLRSLLEELLIPWTDRRGATVCRGSKEKSGPCTREREYDRVSKENLSTHDRGGSVFLHLLRMENGFTARACKQALWFPGKMWHPYKANSSPRWDVKALISQLSQDSYNATVSACQHLREVWGETEC